MLRRTFNKLLAATPFFPAAALARPAGPLANDPTCAIQSIHGGCKPYLDLELHSWSTLSDYQLMQAIGPIDNQRKVRVVMNTARTLLTPRPEDQRTFDKVTSIVYGPGYIEMRFLWHTYMSAAIPLDEIYMIYVMREHNHLCVAIRSNKTETWDFREGWFVEKSF